MPEAPFSIAMIGECMIEMQSKPEGDYSMTFGGDTFNTAAYMARLGRNMGRFVHYVTAIGDDPFSDEMKAFWESQGVSGDMAMRRAGKRPGLYFIKLDPDGERHFYYWRGEAAVKDCFECPGSDELLASLKRFGAVYLSGISLAVLRPNSRERLLHRLAELASTGTRIYFDCNYRPLLWEDQATARTLYERMISLCACVLLTVEELAVLGVDPTHEAGAAHFTPKHELEVVIKDGANPCTVILKGDVRRIAAKEDAKVVDTTAAGDSFSAAYILGRALGLEPSKAAECSHKVAAAVIGHRGAIIPKGEVPRVYDAV